MKALDENKNSNSGVKLATKHELLIIVVSVHNSSSRKDITRTRGVHHRNIVVVLSRRKMINDSGLTLWSLFVRKKRIDELLKLLKEVVIDWYWTFETYVSPNKNDVTCKRLEPMVYDEKPTHFLMET